MDRSRSGPIGSVGLSGSRPLFPHEYQLSRLGVYTKWTARVDEKHKSRWTILPRPQDGIALLLDIAQRWPLLARFSIELARENGITFWLLLGLNFCQACLPSAELHFSARLIDIAQSVGSGGPLDVHSFALIFTGRIATTLASAVVEHFCALYEEKLNSRFSLGVQTEILKIHCLLDDDELELPETRRQLALLRDLGGSSVYRRIFDPLGFIRVGQSALAVVLGATTLALQLTPANSFFLGLSLSFMALEEFESWYGSKPPVENHDITNDAFLRFQNMFKLGTSKALRREVTMLGIQDYILANALKAKAALGSTATTLGSRTFEQHQPPLRAIHLITQLSRPITTALFILHTTLVAPRSLSPLVSFAEMAVLESAAWNLRVRWASLRRGVSELRGGMDSLEAMYECEKLELRLENRAPRSPYRTRAILDAEGRATKGMEIEFRNVTLRYSSASPHALDNVSFKILPGQLVSIVGHNGSGKTSLVSLLSMSEKITSGEILVNGINILHYSRRNLARVMSFTFQTSPVLPVSIKEYVALGAPEGADDQLVARALEAAAADTVIDQLEDGWLSYGGGMAGAALSSSEWQLPQLVLRGPGVPSLEMLETDMSMMEASMSSEGTLVDGEKDDDRPIERPVRRAQPKVTSLPTTVNGQEATIHFPDHSPEPCVLSGGQWQRIALARSLCSQENDLLVWDEPAASLDPIAEASLFDQILSLRGQSTVLFTTHRLNFCARADVVLLFAEGKLVEQGTHEQLMTIDGGEYRRLWETQAKGFV